MQGGPARHPMNALLQTESWVSLSLRENGIEPQNLYRCDIDSDSGFIVQPNLQETCYVMAIIDNAFTDRVWKNTEANNATAKGF